MPMPDQLSAIFLLIIVFLLGVSLFVRNKERRFYPPGPSPLPIIGNLHQIIAAGDMIQFLQKSRRKYGNVFSVELGGTIRVVVCSYENIHEVLVKNAASCSSRSPKAFSTTGDGGTEESPGVLWAPYPEWKTLRRFALNVLKQEGMGKTALEPRMHEELDIYIKSFIEPNIGKPIDLSESITYVTANIIVEMVAARRYNYDDTTFKQLNVELKRGIRSSLKSALTKGIPFIKSLPGDIGGHNEAQESSAFMKSLSEGWLQDARGRFNLAAPTSYVGQALAYAKKEKNENNAKQIFNENGKQNTL